MNKYFAHISEDGQRKQTVEEHLHGTAELAEQFAAAFDAGEYGRLAGAAHDIGKNSHEFQKRLEGGNRVDHASAGALECAKKGYMLTALCIAGHHGGLPDYGNERTDAAGFPTLIGRLKNAINGSIPPYTWTGSLPEPHPEKFDQDQMFRCSLWTRMLYSALVDADYLDTERFIKNGDVQRGGYASLPELERKLAKHIARWGQPTTDLNLLRNEVQADCLSAADLSPGLFSLTVPTGGGKTISSLAFALRHAIRHGMQRVIYVIPYTSIIEQNAEVFRKILGKNNVLEHHSEAVLKDNIEDLSGRDRSLALATENWDAPIIVTTSVQFFDSLFANRSSKCRKLHNIANSVIIFDEAQMIPMEHLLPCTAVIGTLAKYFHSSAVLCTATQPFIDDLISRFAPDMKIREICHDVDNLFDRLKRTTFQTIGKLDTARLAKLLADKSQALCIVNTRKTAQEVFSLLPQEGVYHLSTLMTPTHREKTLKEIRKRLYSGTVCRVISTSLIEAGVDIDFPVVYRELAGLDSIVQAGGRCNREGKRDIKKSVVSVFELNVKTPPLIRLNVGATKEAMQKSPEIGSPQNISAYFLSLRSLRRDGIDVSNAVKCLEEGFSGCLLPFRTVAERFHLIQNDTKTVYIRHRENEDLLQKLVDGRATRDDYRAAGRFSVQIYPDHYQRLLQTGDAFEFSEGCAILENPALYHTETGLSLKTEESEGIYV